MKLNDICAEMEKIAPLSLAMSFDNVGLLVGEYDKNVDKVLIALDMTMEVLDEAIENGVDLIITHHPLIFKPLKNITDKSIVGQIVLKLIKNDIAYYASHTNLDKSEFGTNTHLANILGLKDYSFINTSEEDDYVCVVGELDTNTDEIIQVVKSKLNLDFVRFVDSGKKDIKRIGVATGSGNSYALFGACLKNKVDLLITGDLTYHTMQFAKDYGLSVIDATHFGTENLVKDFLMEMLYNRLNDVTVISSKVQENIFKTI